MNTNATGILTFPPTTLPVSGMPLPRRVDVAGVDRPAIAYHELVSPGAHKLAHPKPLPGCPNCPPSSCPCGVPACVEFGPHRKNDAGSETSWRELARG